jgi:multidrug efflux pump subunit AcrA (membrane-fusion protein)
LNRVLRISRQQNKTLSGRERLVLLGGCLVLICLLAAGPARTDIKKTELRVEAAGARPVQAAPAELVSVLRAREQVAQNMEWVEAQLIRLHHQSGRKKKKVEVRQVEKPASNVEQSQASAQQMQASAEQVERNAVHEAQNREQAERSLEEAERDRQQAERNREQALKDRLQAERDKQQANRDRLQAEMERQQAELERAKEDLQRKMSEMDRQNSKNNS